MVEQIPVKNEVVGSSPTGGANLILWPSNDIIAL